MTIRPLLLSLAALLAASSATAQIRQNTVEISPYAGYLFGGEFARGSNALFDFTVDVDDDATYGARVGFYVTSNFQLELQASHTETAFVTDDGDDLFGDDSVELGDLDIDYLLGYMTFNFGRRRAVPYITLGAGLARLDPDVPGTSADRENRFTASIGGGIKTFFTPNFGMRFDARYYGTSLDSEDNCDDFFDRCDDRDWLSNGEVTGGLLFAF